MLLIITMLSFKASIQPMKRSHQGKSKALKQVQEMKGVATTQEPSQTQELASTPMVFSFGAPISPTMSSHQEKTDAAN